METEDTINDETEQLEQGIIEEEIVEEDVVDMDVINTKLNMCLRNINETKKLEERLDKVEKDFIEFIKG